MVELFWEIVRAFSMSVARTEERGQNKGWTIRMCAEGGDFEGGCFQGGGDVERETKGGKTYSHQTLERD